MRIALRKPVLAALVSFSCGRTAPFESEPSRQIAFMADRGELGHTELYLVDALDRFEAEPRNVSHGHGQELRFAKWAPDGRHLAFGSKSEMVVLQAPAFDVAFTAPAVWGVAWSATGRFYAHASDGLLRIVDVDSGVATTESVPETLGTHDLVWSPIGDRLLFTVSFDGAALEAVLIEPGGAMRALGLTERGIAVSDVQWSPDTERVAFMDRSDTPSSIWAADLDAPNGIALREVFVPPEGAKNISRFQWGNDSSLLFVSLQGSAQRFLVELTASSHSVTTIEGSTHGLWVAPDGRLLAHHDGVRLHLSTISGGLLSTPVSFAAPKPYALFFGPHNLHVLFESSSPSSYQRSLHHVPARGGPVTTLHQAYAGTDDVAFAPGGRSVLYVTRDPSTIHIADLEPRATVRVFRKWKTEQAIDTLNWADPARFSFRRSKSLYLGFPRDHSVRTLHAARSNLRDFGWVGWQPNP